MATINYQKMTNDFVMSWFPVSSAKSRKDQRKIQRSQLILKLRCYKFHYYDMQCPKQSWQLSCAVYGNVANCLFLHLEVWNESEKFELHIVTIKFEFVLNLVDIEHNFKICSTK